MVSPGDREQVRIGDLPVALQRRDLGVGERDVVVQEAMGLVLTQRGRTARACSTLIGFGSTFGFEDTRTNPLSVTGHVAQPFAAELANHARTAAWWTCASQASATSALTSSNATSVLVERALHHLGRDRRAAGGQSDHG